MGDVHIRFIETERTNDRYKRLYAESDSFRVTADVLKRSNWNEAEILEEWDSIQNDDEAGDYDVP